MPNPIEHTVSVYENGDKLWYVDGECLSEADFNKRKKDQNVADEIVRLRNQVEWLTREINGYKDALAQASAEIIREQST